MPSSLDVMAALGNDEAVRLLKPELERHHYAANLLSARKLVDEQPPEHWNASLASGWLGALRTLDDVPQPGKHFPNAMRTQAWRRKQLQTQLASWAELRHDTLLYPKQSYSPIPGCGYPDGYVEPYPAFYEFQLPASQRMTDEAWAGVLATGGVPARPEWAKEFQAPPVLRSLPPVATDKGRTRRRWRRGF